MIKSIGKLFAKCHSTLDLKEYIISERTYKAAISLTVIYSLLLHTLQRALWIRVAEDKKVTRKYFPELCNL